MVPAGMASDVRALVSNTSARTLILGIDKAGRILQHDRNAADVLGAPGALLGVELGSLIITPAHVVALTELSERMSFSAGIEAIPALRWLDSLGRLA